MFTKIGFFFYFVVASHEHAKIANTESSNSWFSLATMNSHLPIDRLLSLSRCLAEPSAEKDGTEFPNCKTITREEATG